MSSARHAPPRPSWSLTYRALSRCTGRRLSSTFLHCQSLRFAFAAAIMTSTIPTHLTPPELHPHDEAHAEDVSTTSIGHANGSAVHRHANGHAPGRAPSPIPAYRPPLQDPSLLPDGQHPLSGISVRAFCLGIALGFSSLATILLVCVGSPLWRTPFFLASLSTFHFLEFWTHAAYNTPLATTGAFLLDANGNAYKVAHISAFVETTLMHSILHWPQLFPQWTRWAWFGFGLISLAGGQLVRSLAMIHCGRNFSHKVQTYRRAEHELVTHGVYSIMRHPSYFGFFWWAIGTQVVLGNWFCLAAYVVVLWQFFAHRIKQEERYLVAFFGKEYEEYRAQTGVGIPLIR